MEKPKKYFNIDHLINKEGELTDDDILKINSYILCGSLSSVLMDYLSRFPN